DGSPSIVPGSVKLPEDRPQMARSAALTRCKGIVMKREETNIHDALLRLLVKDFGGKILTRPDGQAVIQFPAGKTEKDFLQFCRINREVYLNTVLRKPNTPAPSHYRCPDCNGLFSLGERYKKHVCRKSGAKP